MSGLVRLDIALVNKINRDSRAPTLHMVFCCTDVLMCPLRYHSSTCGEKSCLVSHRVTAARADTEKQMDTECHQVEAFTCKDGDLFSCA